MDCTDRMGDGESLLVGACQDLYAKERVVAELPAANRVSMRFVYGWLRYEGRTASRTAQETAVIADTTSGPGFRT